MFFKVSDITIFSVHFMFRVAGQSLALRCYVGRLGHTSTGARMNIYIALFRGINVGGNNSLPMKELVVLLKEMGAKKVRTYIQSGTALNPTFSFSTSKL